MNIESAKDSVYMTEPFLSIRDLRKSYDGRTVLSEINLELKKGELLCILGASGSGKSTVLKAVGGFCDIDGGSIVLDGREISTLPPEERNISTVFQSYALFPHINVLDNVIYGLKFKRDNSGAKISRKSRQKMGTDMLETVGLKGYEKKYVANISGGQQQRVALARSLIVRPGLLLLDEPLGNLDAKLRVDMRREIINLQKKFNVSMIFVTHDQEEAFGMADRVVLLDKGRIIQNSTPEALYEKPENKKVLEFIGKSNIFGEYYVRPEMVEIIGIKQCKSEKKKYISENGHYYKDKKHNITHKKNSADDIIKEEIEESFNSETNKKTVRAALIKEINFLGAFIEIIFDTPDGIIRSVILNNGRHYESGDEVYISYELLPINRI